MFDNIIGQDEVISRLKQDMARQSLPGSLLFEGPPLLAKSSSALELARIGSCEEKARWDCPCEQCASHRLLSHPDLIILGPKNLREELTIAVDMLANAPTLASRYFFIRGVRKLTNRFNPELYENEENRLAKIQPLIRSIMEGLDMCRPDQSDDAKAAAEARKLLPVCEKLHDFIPASTPVYQIRSIEQHARLAPWHKQKVIIIEHADRMMDSARNAMLKILEEPPAKTRFILTTSRRQAIIPTILSRLRPYRFIPRNREATSAVLTRVFRLDARGGTTSDWASLETYFLSQRNGPQLQVAGYARQFMAALVCRLENNGLQLDAAMLNLAQQCQQELEQTLAAILKETADFGTKNDAMSWIFPAFLEACGLILRELIYNPLAGMPSQRFAEKFADQSRDSLMRYSTFNINPAALAERLATQLTRTI